MNGVEPDPRRVDVDEQGEGELLGRGEWKDTVFLPALLGPGYSRLEL